MTPEERGTICRFIAHLARAGLAASLYALRHPQTVKQIDAAHALLQETLPGNGEVNLMRIEADLFLEGRPLPRDQYLERFVRSLKEHRISQVTIGRDVEPAELESLVRMIARKTGGKVESSGHLRFSTEEVEIEATPVAEEEPPIRSFTDIPERMMTQLVDTFDACTKHEPLDLSSIVAVVSGFIAAFRKEANPFLALVPLRQMDEYTFTHSIDVCVLNLAQGVSLGFEGQLLHDIGIAAMLHDIGKLFVPKEVLQKPGELDDAEWAFMRQHTVKGAEYLLNNPGIPRLAVLSAYEHHMRFDLSGYPKPPAGWQLNLASQITMVSDCFDAMRTRRVYKDVVDFGRVAGRMLEISGTMLNPSLTLNFINLLKKMGEQL
ncbi:MAG: HD domain-containing protein [Geobacter sp.]|nr:HD domain-containing protein [Geobacter sp.]